LSFFIDELREVSLDGIESLDFAGKEVFIKEKKSYSFSNQHQACESKFNYTMKNCVKTGIFNFLRPNCSIPSNFLWGFR